MATQALAPAWYKTFLACLFMGHGAAVWFLPHGSSRFFLRDRILDLLVEPRHLVGYAYQRFWRVQSLGHGARCYGLHFRRVLDFFLSFV